MTDIHPHRPLSRIELLLLARLSAPKPPTHTDIVKSLAQFGVPLDPAALIECATATLVSLQRRGLIAEALDATGRRRPATESRKVRKTPKRKVTPRFVLTEDGRLTLRILVGLEATPTWKEMCDRVVPALALGEQPGAEAADAAIGSVDAMLATWLRRDRALGRVANVAELCDRIIARQLGMPSCVATPDGIRAFALAKHWGIDNKAEFERIAAIFEPVKGFKPGKPTSSKKAKKPDRLKALAADFTTKQLDTEVNSKAKISKALVRHWISQLDESDDAQSLSTSRSTPPQSGRASTGVRSSTSQSAASTAVGAALLTAVRDAIPMVGSAGRYGKENVFVAALWQQIEHDRRLPQLSLDHFKQWLVDANRHQLLALARADLVDDMDARLVEDSEIEDLGETFHFVVDHRETLSALGQMHYA